MSQPVNSSDDLLADHILSHPDSILRTIIDHADIHQPQIIYTQINRDANNVPSFQSHTYRLNEKEYFYPASTVKMPTAFMALEKVNQLGIAGLDMETCMMTDSAYGGQSTAYVDASTKLHCPTIANYIRKIFVVSDNDAFNRLYEFVGPQQLNESLHNKGFTNTRIIHRLSIPLPYEQNQYTNPIRFIGTNQPTLYQQNLTYNPIDFAHPEPILLGKGEMMSDSLYQRPKDFAQKNAISLQDLHDMLKAVIFPEEVAEEQRFDLTQGDYQFLYQYMSQLPKESSQLPYSKDTTYYYDAFSKFLMYGDQTTPLPSHIRIFNKIGMAYGFLTDVAYVVDFEHQVEFMLAATVFVNENQVFNDGEYEYDELGLPFLAKLGQLIYDYELTRERPNAPDLDRFRLKYE